MTKPYSVYVVGSTARTLTCALALENDPRFEISHIITPEPKASGRQKQINPNPLHSWAIDQLKPVTLVSAKLDQNLQRKILALPKRPDFLLVVDFGYLVPPWLLELPNIAPVNIHPSALPRWRGSSPGQFAILYGERTSALTIMIMNAGLDEGPILRQLAFEVKPDWTQTEYYQHSFLLAANSLPETLDNLARGKISPTEQPKNSPTPIAQKLRKSETFVEWSNIEKLMRGQEASEISFSPILQAARKSHPNTASLLLSASKAFAPWPGLWTMIPTKSGMQKRMKLLELEVKKTDGKQTPTLVLKKVHIEGQSEPASWNQVKSILANSPT
jgi:methionyl-tRNA formyltransferase